jgi:hypothetical protein
MMLSNGRPGNLRPMVDAHVVCRYNSGTENLNLLSVPNVEAG